MCACCVQRETDRETQSDRDRETDRDKEKDRKGDRGKELGIVMDGYNLTHLEDEADKMILSSRPASAIYCKGGGPIKVTKSLYCVFLCLKGNTKKIQSLQCESPTIWGDR